MVRFADLGLAEGIGGVAVLCARAVVVALRRQPCRITAPDVSPIAIEFSGLTDQVHTLGLRADPIAGIAVLDRQDAQPIVSALDDPIGLVAVGHALGADPRRAFGLVARFRAGMPRGTGRSR